MGTHVLPARGTAYAALHELGQLYAHLHVLVLNELEHDVALCRIGVVALIGLLVVFLQEDDGVLALGHLQVLHHAVLLARALAAPEGVGLEAAGYVPLGQRVDVYGDKQVGLGVVGYLGTFVQLYEAVGLAGIYDVYIGAVALYQLSEGEGILQRQVLLLRDGSLRAGVVASVAGIYHQRELLACCRRGNGKE